MFEKILVRGLEEFLEKGEICSEYVDCVAECIKNSGSRRGCLDKCEMEMISKHGLSLETELYDECADIFYDLGMDIDEMINNKANK